MRKTLVASAVAMSFIVFPAVAVEDFTGFSAGLGAAVSGGEATYSNKDGSSSLGKRSILAVVDLGYSYQIDPLWGIGVGATYDINKAKFGETSSATSQSKVEGKNHYSVYLQPFVVVSPSTAVFAKVGYHSIKMVAKETNKPDFSKKTNGIGYGLGVKTLIADNFYVQAEAGVVDYSKKTGSNNNSLRLKSTTGMLSVGYKF